MAAYRPLQRQDGRWDYTCTNDAGTFPLGYCHEWVEFSVDDHLTREVCDVENSRTAPFRIKYHATGHRTAEQAVACYREYQIDQLLKFEAGEGSKEQRCCEACDEWTSGIGYIHDALMIRWPLCDLHRTRYTVAKFYK